MAPLRFGIVGCGVIGAHHAKMISEQLSGLAELVAVCDVVPERYEKLAAQHGGDGYRSMSDMYRRDDIDAVIVCTPSGQHAGHGVAALRAGKHVVIEKPIDVSLDAADQLRAARDEGGRQLAVISQHRFDTASSIVHDAVSGGRFGRLTSGICQVSWWRSQPYYDSGEWRGTWRFDGGGALMNQSIHTIDLMLWMLGEVDEVYAYTDLLAHERMEVEDTAVAAVRFASGAVGTILGTTAAYPGLTTRLHIHGSRGSAVIDNDDLTYFHAATGDATGFDYGASGRANQAEEVLAQSGAAGEGIGKDAAGLSNAHAKQLRDFIEAVRDDRPPLVTAEDGRRAIELILAIYESGRSGKPIRLGSERAQ